MPSQQLVLLTCMDTRIDPLTIFGFEVGDVHVLRNAGGRVTNDVIRSLAVSTAQFDVDKVLVLHHTDCGMAQQEDVLRNAVNREIEGSFDYSLITLDANSLEEDVTKLRDSKLMPEKTSVAGAVLDIQTGSIQIQVH